MAVPVSRSGVPAKAWFTIWRSRVARRLLGARPLDARILSSAEITSSADGTLMS
jgi:hypothetical protein